MYGAGAIRGQFVNSLRTYGRNGVEKTTDWPFVALALIEVLLFRHHSLFFYGDGYNAFSIALGEDFYICTQGSVVYAFDSRSFSFETV